MQCALCGHEYTPEQGVCADSCPMSGGCSVVCCPNCGYGVPDEHHSTILRLARKAGDFVRRETPHPQEKPDG